MDPYGVRQKQVWDLYMKCTVRLVRQAYSFSPAAQLEVLEFGTWKISAKKVSNNAGRLLLRQQFKVFLAILIMLSAHRLHKKESWGNELSKLNQACHPMWSIWTVANETYDQTPWLLSELYFLGSLTNFQNNASSSLSSAKVAFREGLLNPACDCKKFC